MEYFLAECLDHTIPMPIDVFIDSERNAFSYDKLYSHPRLLKVTLYNHIFITTYGIYPSKLLIQQHVRGDMNICLDTMCKQIGAKISGSEYDWFLKKCLNDFQFVKAQLFSKLLARGVCSVPDFDTSKTLFVHYNHCYDYNSDIKNALEKKLYLCNPYTGFTSKFHEQTKAIVENAKVLTLRDILLFAVYLDKTFFARPLIFLSDTLGCLGVIEHITKSVKDPIIISHNDNPYAHYIVPKEANVIPTITFKLPQHVKDMCQWFDGDDITRLYLNKNSTIPQFVLDHVFRYFVQNNCAIVDKRHGKTDNCLLLIDNRPNVMSLISILISYFNSRWDIIVCTSDKSKEYYVKFLPQLINNVTFITHPLMNLKRPFKINDYNRILKDEAFWYQMKSMNYNYCLIIQDDGILFKPGLERFLEWEYVGAPWIESDHLKEVGITNMVGNGGLSLRNIAKSHEVCSTQKVFKDTLYLHNLVVVPEDVYFCKYMKTPEVNIAKKFSFEMIFDNDALGFHKPWAYMERKFIDMYFQTNKK